MSTRGQLTYWDTWKYRPPIIKPNDPSLKPALNSPLSLTFDIRDKTIFFYFLIISILKCNTSCCFILYVVTDVMRRELRCRRGTRQDSRFSVTKTLFTENKFNISDYNYIWMKKQISTSVAIKCITYGTFLVWLSWRNVAFWILVVLSL